MCRPDGKRGHLAGCREGILPSHAASDLPALLLDEFFELHSLWRAGFALNRALIVTLLVRARDHQTVFAHAFDQVLATAVRALLRNRLRRRCELALRITPAAIKRVALARALFDQFAFLAIRALYADEILFHVLAVRISAARSELPETPVPDDHIAAALRTLLFKRDIRHSLALIETPRGLAIGITRAGHELTEASALEHHDAAAVLAVFLLRRFLQVGRVKVGQIDRVLFGELTSVGILLVVRAARIERSVLTPLDHQGRATEFTFFVRRLLHKLDVFHVLLGVFEILGELLVKLGKRIGPSLLALFNLVEFFFQARGVLEIENVLEVFHQQVRDDQANFGRSKLSPYFGRVLAFLDGA